MDARHALHEVTGRRLDRLVLEEQDEVARALGLLDGDVLLRMLAGAARTVAYGVDHTFRQADRLRGRRLRRRPAERRPLADGVVEQDGEVVLARAADPARDPVAAAARRGRGRPGRAPAGPAHPGPAGRVPAAARARGPLGPDALLALLGAGQAAVSVWEALDTEGLITTLIPDWERIRNRPQRNPLHKFTVDRHLVETAANAATMTREVARPDLLLIAALLHDIGKGWPGDHSVTGEVVARDVGRRMGLPEPDVRAGRGGGPAPPAAAHGRAAPRPGRPDDGQAGRRAGAQPGAARAAARPVHLRRPGHRARRVERLEGQAGRRPGPAGRRRAGRRPDARPGPAAPRPARAGRRGRPGRHHAAGRR